MARGGGRFRRVGTLHVGERLPPVLDALRFNPFNGALEPVGLVNRLREQAYPRSQAAWARNPALARAQADADAWLGGAAHRTLVSRHTTQSGRSAHGGGPPELGSRGHGGRRAARA